MSKFRVKQVETAIDDALGLLKLEGYKEKFKDNGKKVKVKTYVDPFGTNLVIRCGRIKGRDWKLLSIQMPDERFLMKVRLWDDDTYEVLIFDTDISWTWPALVGAYYDKTRREYGLD